MPCQDAMVDFEKQQGVLFEIDWKIENFRLFKNF